MGKAIYLDVADRKVLATRITYEDLVILYNQYIEKYGKVPVFSKCNAEHNMPCQNLIKRVIENQGITYKEFLLQFGKVRVLDVNGVKKEVNDITYEDLVVLYQQYIEKYKEFPVSNKCTLERNMPHRQKIIDILKDKNIPLDTFNKQFNIMDGRHKHRPLKIGDVIGRWEIIGTAPDRFTPKQQRIPHWKCRCTCGSGIVKDVSDNSLKTGNSTSCGCVQLESINKLKGTIRSQSFYDWCVENDRKDFLDRWDYEKNNKMPEDISYCSRESFYFLCPERKHKSSKYALVNVTTDRTKNKLRCRYCLSFAQRLIDVRGENALELYWDYDRNTEDPWKIEGSSKVNGVWLKCVDTDYHGSYYVIRDHAIYGGGCPYCSHVKIHPKDSFGQYLINTYGESNFKKIWNFEKNDVDPFTIAPSTRSKKVWLNCTETDYHPPSLLYPNDVNNHGVYCSYCSKHPNLICKEDSLGYLHPKSVELWSDKNDKSPYEYFPKSNQKVWWKCENEKHEDYQRNICDATALDFRCPCCSQERSFSFLQEKVSNYIKNTYGYTILHEGYCNVIPINPKTNCKLFFDNEIVEIKLIIEVHGQQHYELTGFTKLTAKHYGTTPEVELEYLQWKDNYKKQFALDNGYSYLEIPYLAEKDDYYKKLIDDKIKEICKEAA